MMTSLNTQDSLRKNVEANTPEQKKGTLDSSETKNNTTSDKTLETPQKEESQPKGNEDTFL